MRRIMLSGWSMLFVSAVLACDVCGTSLGIQPNDGRSYIGTWYRMRYLNGRFPPSMGTATKHGGAEDIAAETHRIETYQAVEARAELWLNERWTLWAIVPWVNHYASANGRVETDIYGVGDPSLMLRRVVLGSRAREQDPKRVHRLTVGAGAKCPLGSVGRSYEGIPVDADLQPGSGTWDALFSVEYLRRKDRWGAAFSSVGRVNSRDAAGRRGGHGVNATAELFHILERKDHQWMPSLGAYWEWMARDRIFGADDPRTGGSTLSTHLGIRYWHGRWNLNINWQHAVYHDQGADMMPNRQRIVGGVNRMIGRA